MRSLWERLAPFVFLGFLFVLAVAGLILFSYLLILGALIGLILFVIAWIKGLFSPNKREPLSSTQKKQGRIIDHDQT